MSNGSGKRDRHDIVADILETSRDGAVKTQIMCKAKLSYSQASGYIPMLVKRGFLRSVTIRTHQRVKCLFRTTELGEELLESIRAVDRIWSSKHA